jgi:hypothetical protein
MMQEQLAGLGVVSVGGDIQYLASVDGVTF